MIYKPLKKILFRDNNSDNILFGVDCIDGRAKWTYLTKILSLKFQVLCDAEEIDKLNNLEIGTTFSALEIVSSGRDELIEEVRFNQFTIKRKELRSFTMYALNSPMIARYFVEGEAISSSIFESN